jgi:hypothetical protein
MTDSSTQGQDVVIEMSHVEVANRPDASIIASAVQARNEQDLVFDQDMLYRAFPFADLDINFWQKEEWRKMRCFGELETKYLK